MGMVHQPVDQGRGQAVVDELVEPGGVQVGGHHDGALLVAGVDEPVEAFGGVGGDRQEADVVNDDQVGAHDGGEPFGDRVVDTVPADQGAEVFDGEPGHGTAAVDGVLSEGFTEVALSGARGAAHHQVLPTGDPFEGA